MTYDLAKNCKRLEAAVRAKDTKIADLRAEIRRLNAYVERSAAECPCRNPVISNIPYFSFRCFHCGDDLQNQRQAADHAEKHHHI